MPLTSSTASLSVLTASDAPGAGAALAGLLDELGSAVLDEGGGFILSEDGT